MVWIDNNKAYDIIQQNLIIDNLTMYEISGEVIKFIENTKGIWRVEQVARGKS